MLSLLSPICTVYVCAVRLSSLQSTCSQVKKQGICAWHFQLPHMLWWPCVLRLPFHGSKCSSAAWLHSVMQWSPANQSHYWTLWHIQCTMILYQCHKRLDSTASLDCNRDQIDQQAIICRSAKKTVNEHL